MNEQKLSVSTVVFGLLSVVSVLVVGAVLGVVSNSSSPDIAGIDTVKVTPTLEENIVTVKVVQKGDQVTDYTTGFFPEESAYDLLQRLDKENENLKFGYEEYDFGVFLTSINAVKADPNSEFWSFSYNGIESPVGIGDYEVNNNDILQFRLVNFDDAK